ncbi:MAG TPA: TonB-dependent receptor [Steroidobacteraceae bacterium]|jgi:TonB-dependent receptor|nr:TonB-dependent receptor [Steroidobacteraceae bacterium]
MDIRSAGCCLVLALSLGLPITARSQAQTPSEDVDEVVVTGFRQSYANAVKAKREAVGVTDSISSEGLGRFPDLNVGEALQRLPGIQINREAESRNATINLRGLPGTYARVTLNGLNFADPILDDSTPLGAFNSDVFSGIAIVKSPSAADQPGGISGNIDLQIQGALARTDGFSVKLAGEHDDLGSYTTPALTVGGARHFMGDKLAAFATVAYKQEEFRRDSIFFNQYTLLNTTTTPNYAARFGTVPGGVLFPSDVRQAVKYNKGDLLTAVTGAELEVNDQLKFGLDAFLTRRQMHDAATDILDVDMRNGATVVDPTGSVFAASGANYINAYNFSNTQVFASFRSEPFEQKTWGTNLRGEWSNDDWRFEGVATMSRANNHLDQSQLDIRRQAQAAGNGTTGSFFSGGGDVGDYQFTLGPDPAVIDTSGPWAYSGAGPSMTNPAGNVFIVAGSEGNAHNDLDGVQFELERKLESGWLSSIEVGARFEKTSFTSRGRRSSAAGLQRQNIDPQFIKESDFAGSFFGGEAGDYLSNWQTVNYDYAVSRLQPVTLAPGQIATANGWVNDSTNGSFLSFNFTNDNDIGSAYAMAKFDKDLGGRSLRANVGLRYEDTSNTIRSLDRNAAQQFVTNTYQSDYDNVLPSAIVAYDLTEKLVIRGAAYRTFVRPQPRQVSPATLVSPTANGFSVTFGNLNLHPYDADSYDLSLEWYNRTDSLIALAAYRKKITGLIGPQSNIAVLCPADATELGLGHLTVNGTSCLSDILVNGNPAVITASGNVNQENPIVVKGLELSLQQNLDFLPAPWNHFGGALNFSYADIEGRTVAGTPATLPGVSKRAGNFISYYETSRFGVRLVYNYRDDYDLAAGGTFSGAARSVKARGQIDASASFNITPHFSVAFDAFNLTNELRVEYQNVENIPRRADFDGRTFQVSLRADL